MLALTINTEGTAGPICYTLPIEAVKTISWFAAAIKYGSRQTDDCICLTLTVDFVPHEAVVDYIRLLHYKYEVNRTPNNSLSYSKYLEQEQIIPAHTKINPYVEQLADYFCDDGFCVDYYHLYVSMADGTTHSIEGLFRREEFCAKVMTIPSAQMMWNGVIAIGDARVIYAEGRASSSLSDLRERLSVHVGPRRYDFTKIRKEWPLLPRVRDVVCAQYIDACAVKANNDPVLGLRYFTTLHPAIHEHIYGMRKWRTRVQHGLGFTPKSWAALCGS